MDQAGEFRTAADRSTVWAALNDAGVLQRCIAGCQSLERTTDTTFSGRVKAKVNQLTALFEISLQLADIDSPNSYTLHIDAQADVNAHTKGVETGFVNAITAVRLGDDGMGTVIAYTVAAKVGGALVELETHQFEDALRKNADDFFVKLALELSGETTSASVIDDARSAEGYQPSQQGIIWAIMFGVLILAVVLTL